MAVATAPPSSSVPPGDQRLKAADPQRVSLSDYLM